MKATFIVHRAARSAAVLVAVLVSIGGCVDRSRPPGVGPTPRTENPEEAKAHLNNVLSTMESYSINKDTLDWAGIRTEVMAAAVDARSTRDLFPAIELALRRLNDHESYYQSADGTLVGPSPVGGCGSGLPTPPTLPDTIGYVKIDSCDCEGDAATRFAASIQRAIEATDRPGLAGWIVDLRGNFGGNMWPMIAGVGPVLGEGVVGWIIYNNREYEREYRNGASLSLGEAFTKVAEPYTLLRSFPNVAVLTDAGTVSAAEAVTVFFRARPATRSFGTATCGHHHLQQGFPFGGAGTLHLVTAQSADRTKKTYSGPINPDELIVDPEAAISRAVAWLQSGR